MLNFSSDPAVGESVAGRRALEGDGRAAGIVGEFACANKRVIAH